MKSLCEAHCVATEFTQSDNIPAICKAKSQILNGPMTQGEEKWGVTMESEGVCASQGKCLQGRVGDGCLSASGSDD